MAADNPVGAAAIERRVRELLAARVGDELANTIPGGEPFDELGVDSLDIVLTLAELERAYGVRRIADGDLWEIAGSVDALVLYLSRGGEVTG